MRLAASLVILLAILSTNLRAQKAKTIDFDRDIRPILSDRCYFCHGPDANQRQAGLRLDLHDEALYVITPGDPDDSELWLRILSEDDDEKMPPAESKLSISNAERELIRTWIEQGATWKGHWAFEPRSNRHPPVAKQDEQAANDIDRFLLKRLEQESLSYSQPATKEKLIRRVTFDLTGLPPTLAEIDAFLTDDSPNAFEKVVDRVLKSKHYGQRMASDWLDVARYSDTYGYQVDRDRYVWPWRDWVTRVFNENKPYDDFIVEQLAGDLLPSPATDQILATTFNRLHPQKVEGGSVEEEFRVEYVADRTQTFATAFLGLTLECARCHDHKFDPISQREYYELFSFFNNIDESGLYSFFTNSVPTPTLQLATNEQKEQLEDLRAGIEQIVEAIAKTGKTASEKIKWDVRDVLTSKPPIEQVDFATIEIARNQRTTDDKGNPAVKLTGDDAVTLQTGNFERFQPFSVTLSMKTPDVKDRAVIFHRSRAWTDAGSRGYQLLIEDGKLSASLIHFWPGNAIRVVTRERIPVDRWLDVAVVYDGSMRASGLQIFVEGEKQVVDVERDKLTRNITGGGGDTITIGERFRDRGFTDGMVSSFQVFDRQISDLEVAAIHQPETLKELERIVEQGELTGDQEQLLWQHYFLNRYGPAAYFRKNLKSAREQFCQVQDSIPEIMVMRELPQPRPAFLLERGLYNMRQDPVSAGIPEILPEMKPDLPPNRLGLAHWLTDPEHPLTARVAVNHYWQMIFGAGLVHTPEDFGRQGARPTHPELLDWLANDFVENGWDVKRLLKQMVLSNAYRQTSAASPELLQRDPDNKLLARAPTYRLPAEMLRDNVLAVSGLLVDKIGGPPVKPYELEASFKPSRPDTGEGLYRRSLYTYWKRTGPAPVMMTLDAAKRDVCRVQRERTSSPLQALAMLNGPQFVEACRALSHRLIQQHGSDAADEILRDMFRCLTSRLPSEAEKKLIESLYQKQLDYFQANEEAMRNYLSNGKFADYDSSNKTDLAVLAAWSSVANTLINHHECVTKR